MCILYFRTYLHNLNIFMLIIRCFLYLLKAKLGKNGGLMLCCDPLYGNSMFYGDTNIMERCDFLLVQTMLIRPYTDFLYGRQQHGGNISISLRPLDCLMRKSSFKVAQWFQVIVRRLFGSTLAIQQFQTHVLTFKVEKSYLYGTAIHAEKFIMVIRKKSIRWFTEKKLPENEHPGSFRANFWQTIWAQTSLIGTLNYWEFFYILRFEKYRLNAERFSQYSVLFKELLMPRQKLGEHYTE